MALVTCPECGNKISDTAESCPQCGFPYRRYQQYIVDEKERIQHEGQRILQQQEAERAEREAEERRQNKKCPECGKVIGQVDVCPYCGCDVKLKETQDRQQTRQVQEAQRQYNAQRTSSTVELPRCPTCGSTNVKRVSVVTKAVNAGMFGILGNRRKKQFHCNNCGYEW